MINGLTYNELAIECHANNAKWWRDLETGERLVRNKGELLMLAISEVAEAMEGERKGLMDDKLPHRPAAEVELVDCIIRLADYAGGHDYVLPRYDYHPKDYYISNNRGETLLELCLEIGDIYRCDVGGFVEASLTHLVRALNMIRAYADKFGYDLDGAYREKTAYNKVRKDHSAEHRKAEGGKKW